MSNYNKQCIKCTNADFNYWLDCIFCKRAFHIQDNNIKCEHFMKGKNNVKTR